MLADLVAFSTAVQKFGLTSMEQNQVLRLIVAHLQNVPGTQSARDAEAYIRDKIASSNARTGNAFLDWLTLIKV